MPGLPLWSASSHSVWAPGGPHEADSAPSAPLAGLTGSVWVPVLTEAGLLLPLLAATTFLSSTCGWGFTLLPEASAALSEALLTACLPEVSCCLAPSLASDSFALALSSAFSGAEPAQDASASTRVYLKAALVSELANYCTTTSGAGYSQDKSNSDSCGNHPDPSHSSTKRQCAQEVPHLQHLTGLSQIGA